MKRTSCAAAPLIIDGAAPLVLPARPLFGPEREGRALFVWERTVYLRCRHGWRRIPRGYVTDWGSIPRVATALSFCRIEPYDRHAVAAAGHDWDYAVGEPGQRAAADADFLARMEMDGVARARRDIMHRCVRFFGGGGYKRASSWWETQNFADPDTGEYPVRPPFPREEAFVSGAWGLRPQPWWPEHLT